MAKLEIELELDFQTKALLVDEDFNEIFLDYENGRAKFKTIQFSELEFEVCSTNEGSEMSFLFKQKDGKKGSIFHVEHRGDAPGLSAKLSGSYSVSLRSGADSLLKEHGAELDLRLRAVTWKGGAYMGFAAVVEGGDHEQEGENWQDTFPKIENFKIK